MHACKISVEIAIKKYLELVKSDDFVRYKKEFADKIVYALSNRYREDKNEIHLVHAIEDIVNQVDNLTISNIFELSTKSIFNHGNMHGNACMSNATSTCTAFTISSKKSPRYNRQAPTMIFFQSLRTIRTITNPETLSRSTYERKHFTPNI